MRAEYFVPSTCKLGQYMPARHNAAHIIFVTVLIVRTDLNREQQSCQNQAGVFKHRIPRDNYASDYDGLTFQLAPQANQ